ncbi:MAG TPA: preprotein translocase subunit SecE [Planctomycetia bacterium]|nr:preprotein translocase subunit SecE [Planctomycetia bacterium]
MALISGTRGELLRSLVSFEPYKPGQGVWARYGTLGAASVLALFGVYSWIRTHSSASPGFRYILPAVLAASFIWIVQRLIHYPRFADFLITTEAEMNKVSWPQWAEVKVTTVVVLVLAVLLASYLYAVDWAWNWILWLIGVLKIRGGSLGDNA